MSDAGQTWWDCDVWHPAIGRALQIDRSQPGGVYALSPFRLANIEGRHLILAAFPAPRIFTPVDEDWLDIDSVIAWNPIDDTAVVLGDVQPQIVGRLADDSNRLFHSPRAFFQAWAMRRAQYPTLRRVHGIAEGHDAPGALMIGRVNEIRWNPRALPSSIECVDVDAVRGQQGYSRDRAPTSRLSGKDGVGMSWSPQQDRAIADVRAWLADRAGKQVFRLFGYAGTGKTTLAKELARSVRGTVLYATFTGKASLVLRQKGCEDASTIHSLIYRVDVNDRTGEATFILNEDSAMTGAALLIVDEVSMVGEELAKDLLSFGRRVLVLGDPAQLPPVKDEGFFINSAPDVMLTEVHRQAQDNPIIRMSMDIREGGRLKPGAYGDSLVTTRSGIGFDRLQELVLDADQLLCGMNRTRVAYNRRIRALKGLAGDAEVWHPTVGDRLICLRNKRDKALFNGGMWQADKVGDKFGCLSIEATSLDEDRDPLTLEVAEEFFTGSEHKIDWRERRKYDEFTFGWAITCHKSQGSQWPHVIVFDESGAFREARSNWLYTAVTRAAERVTVVI